MIEGQREWMIRRRLLKGRDEFKLSVRGPRADDFVHVIEYSAYEAVCRERDQLKREVEELKEKYEKLLFKFQGLKHYIAID